ncbi:hypothetical protein SAMN04487820_102226 [Actinopolyspora mzabensis]|uniref:Uncharacterized protein n=1 Tax=Actinopolyspora mzabensis TaxID=995066 RepID=A0A1G8WW17_ACTMZ|nr:hypothetical protein SAMN04487820_102226 [Actinopolyspora mzabensis]
MASRSADHSFWHLGGLSGRMCSVPVPPLGPVVEGHPSRRFPIVARSVTEFHPSVFAARSVVRLGFGDHGRFGRSTRSDRSGSGTGAHPWVLRESRGTDDRVGGATTARSSPAIAREFGPASGRAFGWLWGSLLRAGSTLCMCSQIATVGGVVLPDSFRGISARDYRWRWHTPPEVTPSWSVLRPTGCHVVQRGGCRCALPPATHESNSRQVEGEPA